MILDYCIKNIVPFIVMLCVCYILGLLVDRVADIILDVRKQKIKSEFKIQSKISILVWNHFEQNSFASFILSRIRLLRSTVLNSAILALVVPFAIDQYFPDNTLPSFCLCFLL